MSEVGADVSQTRESRTFHLKPRFSLLTLLVLVTTLAVSIGLFVEPWRRARQKKKVAGEVERLGGKVIFAEPPEATGVISGWLHLIFGDEYFADVSRVFCRLRSEDDVELLHAFPEVTHLRLSGPRVTGATLERLAGLSQVSELKLSEAVISPRGLQSLTKLPQLEFLAFSNCTLLDAASQLGALTELPNLQSLTFIDCGLSDDSLKALYGAPSLTILYLHEPGISEEGILAACRSNPALAINFGGQRSKTENYIPSAEELPNVTELTFTGPHTSNKTLVALRGARSLSTLRLDRCRVTDSGLRHLLSLPRLTRLELKGSTVNATRLSELRQRPEFSDLARTDCSVTDLGLEHISDLRALTHLTVVDCQLTDQGLESVGKLMNLTKLALSGDQISDAGVRALRSLQKLNTLYLKSSQMTDDSLVVLKSMTSLRQLTLHGVSISDGGVTELQQALPNCTISLWP
jgi:Leucine-rich repeat (LRR) protein